MKLKHVPHICTHIYNLRNERQSLSYSFTVFFKLQMNHVTERISPLFIPLTLGNSSGLLIFLKICAPETKTCESDFVFKNII